MDGYTPWKAHMAQGPLAERQPGKLVKLLHLFKG